MPQSTSAKKRVKQNVKAQEHNKAKKSEMRTQMKKVRAAIKAGDKAAALKHLPRAMKLLDKAARKNVIHANKAARDKSILQRGVDAI